MLAYNYLIYTLLLMHTFQRGSCNWREVLEVTLYSVKISTTHLTGSATINSVHSNGHSIT